jgi:hypothetical protein
MFEVFNAVTGATVATVATAAAAQAMAMRCGGGYDYDRAASGFYVVDMGGRSCGRHNDKAAAERASDMRNMGSDNNSFHVVAA